MPKFEYELHKSSFITLSISYKYNDYTYFRYGSRATSEECPHAIILMCLQSIIGVLSSTCMAGIVFAKLARPKVCIYWTTESLNYNGERGAF